MRIFVVSEGFPEPPKFNTGIFAWDQAKALKSIGLEVAFLVLDCRSLRRWRRWGYRYFFCEGIPVFRMDVPLGKIPDDIFFTFSRKAFSALISKAIEALGKPDIIHAHFMKTGVSISVASKKLCIPFIITEHSSQVFKGRLSDASKKYTSEAYQRAAAVIAVSQGLARVIQQQYDITHVQVIPNILDTSLFTYQVKERNWKDVRIVSAGNLVTSKRHDMTIHALAALLPEHPHLKLTICGEGPQRSRLEDLIARLGVEQQVNLTGHISRQELAEIFRFSDFFVLPSSFETFGLVYAEAIAAGLPVIATRCGGPEDFVNKDNGILIEVDNQKALENAMRDMIIDFPFYHISINAALVQEYFSPQTITAKLVRVYCNLQEKSEEKKV